jgi:hypothetical protein
MPTKPGFPAILPAPADAPWAAVGSSLPAAFVRVLWTASMSSPRLELSRPPGAKAARKTRSTAPHAPSRGVTVKSMTPRGGHR